MSDAYAERRLNTFVIRIWQAWSLSEPRWHGRIEHLQSGNMTTFQNLDQILTFMQAAGIILGDIVAVKEDVEDGGDDTGQDHRR